MFIRLNLFVAGIGMLGQKIAYLKKAASGNSKLLPLSKINHYEEVIINDFTDFWICSF